MQREAVAVWEEQSTMAQEGNPSDWSNWMISHTGLGSISAETKLSPTRAKLHLHDAPCITSTLWIRKLTLHWVFICSVTYSCISPPLTHLSHYTYFQLFSWQVHHKTNLPQTHGLYPFPCRRRYAICSRNKLERVHTGLSWRESVGYHELMVAEFVANIIEDDDVPISNPHLTSSSSCTFSAIRFRWSIHDLLPAP